MAEFKDLGSESASITTDDIIATESRSFEVSVAFDETDLPNEGSSYKSIAIPSPAILIESISITKTSGTATHFDFELSRQDFGSIVDESNILLKIKDLTSDVLLFPNIPYKSSDNSRNLWIRITSYCGSLALTIRILGRIRRLV